VALPGSSAKISLESVSLYVNLGTQLSPDVPRGRSVLHTTHTCFQDLAQVCGFHMGQLFLQTLGPQEAALPQGPVLNP
jgi:hypothetical protein